MNVCNFPGHSSVQNREIIQRAKRMVPDADEIRQRVETRLKKRAEFAMHLVMFVIFNGLAWVLYWPFMGQTFPWPAAVSLLWGAGLLGHGLETLSYSGRQSAAKERAVRGEMTELFGDDWQSTVSAEDYNKVRDDVETRFKRRMDFVMHAAMFLPINALAWMIWIAISHWEYSPWLPVAFTSLWGMGLAGHAVDTFFTTRQSAREQAIREEMEREWQHIQGVDKPKRKRKNDARLNQAKRLQLTSDGELLDIVDDESEVHANGKEQ
jgi:2TM domain-containing protein